MTAIAVAWAGEYSRRHLEVALSRTRAPESRDTPPRDINTLEGEGNNCLATNVCDFNCNLISRRSTRAFYWVRWLKIKTFFF